MTTPSTRLSPTAPPFSIPFKASAPSFIPATVTPSPVPTGTSTSTPNATRSNSTTSKPYAAFPTPPIPTSTSPYNTYLIFSVPSHSYDPSFPSRSSTPSSTTTTSTSTAPCLKYAAKDPTNWSNPSLVTIDVINIDPPSIRPPAILPPSPSSAEGRLIRSSTQIEGWRHLIDDGEGEKKKEKKDRVVLFGTAEEEDVVMALSVGLGPEARAFWRGYVEEMGVRLGMVVVVKGVWLLGTGRWGVRVEGVKF